MLDAANTLSHDPLSEPTAQDAELAHVLEVCLADMEAGRPVDLDALADAHPEIAERLRACLCTLDLVQQARASLTAGKREPAPAAVGRLGDFDIIREVGRGGMGVVYEAQQISLGRRVALKVLPFAATLDPRQLQRFLMEAQAAAILHHVHIVPIYSVGCERGVHYYSMQFIDGQTLAEAIAALRRGGALEAESLSRERQKPPTDSAPTVPTTALITQRSTDSPGYFRAVARIGVQAALALEHAHQLGVIHRDIKPANLLLDRAGDLWITDFGLARLRSHAEITMSGDAVGTLRYMSPEQALAKRALVDHRTDIYSLGATLYEALTLQPAYLGSDREEILRNIARGEPMPPRRINRSAPAEVETVILKAMAQEPERRYATAKEFADDLTRYLEHRPIRARRPGLQERMAKWAWRHKTILTTAAVVAALAVIGLGGMTVRLWQEQGHTNAALQLARTNEQEAQKNQALAEANFRKALGGINRLLWELENPRWNSIPGFQDARSELTRQGLEIFQEFVDEKGADPAVRFQAGRAYEILVNVYLVSGQIEQAEQAHRKAVDLFEHLLAEYPERAEYGLVLVRIQTVMGNWDFSYKRHEAAKEAFRGAIKTLHKSLPLDRDGWIHNNLAFLLCDCLEKDLRNPRQAVALATQALTLGPHEPSFWTTLGFAHYRAGEWEAGRAALNKSLEWKESGAPQNWLLQAMIAWRLNERRQAREWYDRAAAWLEDHPMTDELYHVRKEAADMMGIDWPKPPVKTASSNKGS